MCTVKAIAGLGLFVAALVLGLLPGRPLCGETLGLSLFQLCSPARWLLPVISDLEAALGVFEQSQVSSCRLHSHAHRQPVDVGSPHSASAQGAANTRERFPGPPCPRDVQDELATPYIRHGQRKCVFVSRALIKLYATNGRIWWWARIAGQMAVQPFETWSCKDAGRRQ